MKLKPFTPKKFRRRVFSQLWMLALQFIVGMLLNIIGSETSGASHVVYNVVLVVHVLNAIGLVEGGIYIAVKERNKLSWWTALALFATSCAGVLTVVTGQDIWSFAMACGFLVSAWLCVVLYMRADRVLRGYAE